MVCEVFQFVMTFLTPERRHARYADQKARFVEYADGFVVCGLVWQNDGIIGWFNVASD